MAAPRPPMYAEPDPLVVHGEPRPAPAEDRLELVPAQPAVVAHLVDLVEAGSFARAVCAGCGWSGPARRSRAVATADAAEHPAALHPAARQP